MAFVDLLLVDVVVLEVFIDFLHLSLQLPIVAQEIFVFAVHFLDGQDVLLTLAAENFVLADEQVDEFVDGLYFLNADDG